MADAEIIPIGTRGRPGRGTGQARPSSAARGLAGKPAAKRDQRRFADLLTGVLAGLAGGIARAVIGLDRLFADIVIHVLGAIAQGDGLILFLGHSSCS